ncbi:hypothetical protein [Streptomyces sp. NBC_01477]|uniref:hypothetical protein n=1 Tax=Streptomyces sp. NBC_01477 TaxID=2976015 RepID=UPI002E346C0D|nr:hypothetical protein [Streptomyces sp. NBC_01477]
MPATPSGSPACPDADLPSRLADLIPSAACPLNLDLATAPLIRSGLVAAGRGR